MKTKLFSLAVLVAIYSVTYAHAANNPADAQAAFQEFNEAANALKDLENAPLNQWQDQYNRAVDGLNRLGITGDQQQGDLIANVHNIPSITALSEWIGGMPQSQVTPETDTKAQEQADLRARFNALKQAQEEGQSKIADNQARTASQHVDDVQTRVLAQQERDTGQDLAISDTHTTASQAMTTALSAQSYAETVHDQVMRLGVDVDTNKAKNDTQDQEISGLATQGNTNAQNIADEAQIRKDTDTAIITQMNTDKATQVQTDAEQNADIKTAQTTADQKLDKSVYTHDHLLQAVKDGEQDQTIANNQSAQETVNQGFADQISDNYHQTQENTQILTEVKASTDAQSLREQIAGSTRYTSMVAAHNQAVTDNTPKPVNGVDGKDGVDGVTTTLTKVETDTATRSQVANNTSAIRGVRSEQAAQSDYIQKQSHVINQHSALLQQHSAQIELNTADIQKNTKDIADTKDKLKKGLNNAAAMSSLHFDANKNSWALSTGTANGDGAALAGGLQKQLTEHTAVTVQFSDSMSGDWMAGAGIHGDY